MRKPRQQIRCGVCELPITAKNSDDIHWNDDRVPFHGICFDIVSASLEEDIKAFQARPAAPVHLNDGPAFGVDKQKLEKLLGKIGKE